MRLRLDRQIAWAVVLVLVASMGLSVALHALSLRDDVDRQLGAMLTSAERTFAGVLEQDEAVLSAAVAALAEQSLLKAVLSSDRVDTATLQGVADEQRETLKVDVLVFLGPDGTRRAASPQPTLPALDGWAGKPGTVLVAGAVALVPVRQPVLVDGRLVGVVVAARRVDDRVLGRLFDFTGVDALLLVNGAEAAVSARHPWTLGLVGVEPTASGPVAMTVGGTSVSANRIAVVPQAQLWLVHSRDAAMEGFRRAVGELVGLGALSVALAAVTLAFFLRRVRARVRVLVGEVTQSANSLQSAASGLKSSATEEAARTSQHAAAIEGTRQTMGSMLDAASRISAASEGVSLRASHTASANGQLSANVLELSAQVQRISEISDTIRSIADKSDLLALNASLEGARAGEAGRGFALVGTEMRRLAEQVAQATEEVQRLAVDVRFALSASVTSSELGLKLAKETSAAVHEITQLTQAQKKATEDVGQSMQVVGGLLERSTTSTRATLVAANDLAGTAQRLEGATRDFAEVLGGDAGSRP